MATDKKSKTASTWSCNLQLLKSALELLESASTTWIHGTPGRLHLRTAPEGRLLEISVPAEIGPECPGADTPIELPNKRTLETILNAIQSAGDTLNVSREEEGLTLRCGSSRHRIKITQLNRSPDIWTYQDVSDGISLTITAQDIYSAIKATEPARGRDQTGWISGITLDLKGAEGEKPGTVTFSATDRYQIARFSISTGDLPADMTTQISLPTTATEPLRTLCDVSDENIKLKIEPNSVRAGSITASGRSKSGLEWQLQASCIPSTPGNMLERTLNRPVNWSATIERGAMLQAAVGAATIDSELSIDGSQQGTDLWTQENGKELLVASRSQVGRALIRVKLNDIEGSHMKAGLVPQQLERALRNAPPQATQILLQETNGALLMSAEWDGNSWKHLLSTRETRELRQEWLRELEAQA